MSEPHSDSRRRFVAGADIVLPGRIVSGQTLVIEGGRIVDLTSGVVSAGPGEIRIDAGGCLLLPGFVDVHVHGAAGTDVLDGAGAIAVVAGRLPRWGVTAFCPTTIACTPDRLREFLIEVARLRSEPPPNAARVLPAHLESNFINPEYRGAQPIACLRRAVPASRDAGPSGATDGFSAREVFDAIDRHRPDIGIVTLAPEIDGGLALVRRLASSGVRVSLGHSGATFEEAQSAFAAGARQATHLFNRMSPMSHRDPGLVGATLSSEDIAAELICDGHHVHPAVMRVAIAAKGCSRVMAITDGTAGSGLPPGSRARLGGQSIVTGDVARLDDGTTAGSVLTMDRAFATLVTTCGLTLPEAAELCATTPARELGLQGHGVLAPGAVADLVVFNARLEVVSTWVAGFQVWPPSS
jgi:N-acetylglucosamine-6-phosphate deacetylase